MAGVRGKFLPSMGRWREATEGQRLTAGIGRWGYPSTILRMVPLPVPGRNL
ncbi:MAG: hypothetical protein RLY97_1922 [Pseudomonadota bacterium]